MSIRTTMLALAISSIGIAAASAAPAPKTQGHGGGGGSSSGGFLCTNGDGSVGCIGAIAGLVPVVINISNNSVLSGDDLSVLEGSLNGITIDNILNKTAILNGASLNILDIFNNYFDIPLTLSQINVCTLPVLGIQLCSNH